MPNQDETPTPADAIALALAQARTSPPECQTTVQRLWDELAAMAARARQEENWQLMHGGPAQDLGAAERVLRETKKEAER